MSEQMKMDAERAAFEVWVTADRVKTWRKGDSYSEWYTGALNAWIGWQARASLPVGVPVSRIVEAGERLYSELRQWLATESDPDSQAALQAWRDIAAPTVKAEQVDDFELFWSSELRDELRKSCARGWAELIWKAATAAARFNFAYDASLPAAGSAVEEVEVVARAFKCEDKIRLSATNLLPKTDGYIDLMTVAQHERIVAALSAQQSALPTVNGHKFNCKAVDDYNPGNCSCGAEAEQQSASERANVPVELLERLADRASVFDDGDDGADSEKNQ